MKIPMMDKMHEVEYFNCVCNSPEHTVRFCYDKESIIDDGEGIWMEVYLNQHRSFFKRLWVAIKYLFGYTCKYGHWDTFILASSEVSKFKEMINTFDQELQKYNST